MNDRRNSQGRIASLIPAIVLLKDKNMSCGWLNHSSLP